MREERLESGMSPVWLGIGGLGALGFLIGLLRANETLMQFVRIFPHLALLAWWWNNRGSLDHPKEARVRFALLIGLVACTAADYVIRKPQGFVAGVFGFLIAQVAFISAFLARDSRPAWAGSVPFLVYAGALMAYLWPNLGPMQAPVAVYALAIAGMGWRAWITGVPTLRWGALLFMASDSLLAIEKFGALNGELTWLRVPVILTYWAALVFLMKKA